MLSITHTLQTLPGTGKDNYIFKKTTDTWEVACTLADNTRQWKGHLHTLQTTQGNGWDTCTLCRQYKAMDETPALLADNTRQWMRHLHTLHTTQGNRWGTYTPCR